MNALALPRTAVDRYLRVVRLPLDRAIALLPGDETGAGPAAKLTVDRVDAEVRAAIAALLRDPALRRDAEREAARHAAEAAQRED
ncbi:MAG TPA: hypothetical protein VNR66_14125, partial [Solirubrobacteraceae bacterium]|nr:hypothetical protein [Solirubrobacteraceae bacterium]